MRIYKLHIPEDKAKVVGLKEIKLTKKPLSSIENNIITNNLFP